ncbi:hypothetical protein ONA92_21850 [Mycobacteroides salmoniphilum]|uniref:hypothetical protein n=1 Tax=Mycobacteroides salmoniphilum TaxID=404941 RepID=UPI003569BAA6
MSTARKAPAKKAAPRKAAATAAGEDAPAPAGAVPPKPKTVSPYPDGTPLYEYTSAAGVVILFPKITAIAPPDNVFWWELYNAAPRFQPFIWMDHADVPKSIQRTVVELPPEEFRVFLDGWFAEANLSAEK